MATQAFVPLGPVAWLAQQPLQENEHLYLVISAASDSDAVKAFRRSAPTHPLLPIWGETPYATWQPVMPYVAQLEPDSAFLPWIAQTEALDWGWLAVSRCEPETVRAHLRSLTQVKMPYGNEVFFRFWDGRYLQQILEGLGAEAGNLLPVFERYLINGKPLETSPRKVPAARDWPWWEMPGDLADALAKQNPSVSLDGLMQWLEEEHPYVFTAWPKGNLRLKVGRYVRQAGARDNLREALLNDLIQEQG
ncbi:DUF4123 domain-containing protein [Pseudomonas sp. Z5-35]|uniref:DUF4123 domain-containing protein n=1 Tax=unclassified Pseudomonas TaxID=196821 RepID=UPI003DA996A5